MRLVYSWVMTMVAASALSCGDDGSDGTSVGSAEGSGEGGASTEAASTSSGTASSSGASSEESTAASSEGSTAASSEGSTASEETTGATTACGDALTCAAAEVCVQEPFERPCEIVEEGDPCPPDQMPSMCGGAGVPCCCGEPPPPDHTCVMPEGCDGAPTCECITCAPDRFCSEPVGDGPFVCELLPQP